MANRQLFSTRHLIPTADAVNHHGAPAYSFSDRAALAQYAVTGCLNHTFYTSAQTQLADVLRLASRVDSRFLAQTAVYARRKGHMKDMPALLLAVLAARPAVEDRLLLQSVFDRVIDNGKMLRNFVQIVRSGVTGRRSLGSCPKRLVQGWLDQRSDAAIFRASVGSDPSLADIIKMVHPKPKTASRRALYGYLLGRPYDVAALPEIVQEYETWKWLAYGGHAAGLEVPRVPFQMLTSQPLDASAWRAIAASAGWQMTRMNLRTFARHGVFESPSMVHLVAERLANAAEVRKARVFPYQLLQASKMAAGLPVAIREALEAALEVAISNVPSLRRSVRVAVCPDVSGSMRSPVTGHRRGATSAVRCVDVAALVAAAFVRTCRETVVLPFEHRVVDVELRKRDSVLANARKLASIGGGGTSCSAPLRRLVKMKSRVDLVILVSDNESWVDARRPGATETMQQWERLRRDNPGARLVCIDIQPYATSQAPSRPDILNVGGFSDAVFSVIGDFVAGTHVGEHLVGSIDRIVV